ncbi:MAG: TlpA disulfide reductase family protein [Jatrophihabitantaceae bacterium]
MKLRRITGILVAAATVTALASGCSGSGTNTDGSYRYTSPTPSGTTWPIADRKPAENFTGNLLGGGTSSSATAGGGGSSTISLAQQAGKVVVINFWATWCGPCTTETPQFDSVYRAYKSKGVQFLGIDTMNYPPSSAQAFVKDFDITYPMIYDQQGEVALRLGSIPAKGLPFTVLVDKAGRVAVVHIGVMSPKDLEPLLDTLIAES